MPDNATSHNPEWKQRLTDDDIRETGFLPVHDESDPTYQVVAEALVSEADQTKIVVWFSEDNIDQLYVSFWPQEQDWLRIPFDGTSAMLKSIFEAYVRPSRPDAAVVEQEPKLLIWSIGGGNYGTTMQAIEQNELIMNQWLESPPARLATMDKGAISTAYTEYSRTKISIQRELITSDEAVEQNTVFVLAISYQPVTFHTEFSKQCMQQHTDDLPPNIPDDLPLDVLGFFAEGGLSNVQDRARLLERIRGGEQDYLLPLAVITSDEDFEEVFMPFARSESPHERAFVAQEARYRDNQKVLSIATEQAGSTESPGK